MSLKVKNKAIFLDRDGVINIDKQYVSQIEDFEFKEGIFDLLKYFRKLGYLLIIVTNQSGIGRGYYTQEDFETLTKWKLQQLRAEGIEIDKVYHCPHAPELDCGCRKPNPGMLDAAQNEFGIDMGASWMIGDKKSDVDVGKNAGVYKTVLIAQDCTDSKGADFCITKLCELKDLIKV